MLIEYFTKKYNKINNKKIEGISSEVKKIFQEYHWPGNIRELENAIEGAAIMAKTEVINKWDLPNLPKFITSTATFQRDEKNLKKIVEQPERELIIAVLNDCNWNRIKAAATLGVNRTTLYNKMKKYNIKQNSKS